MDVWYEHRRFIVAVASGFLVFFVLDLTAGGLDASSERMRVQSERLETEKAELIDRLQDQEGFEKGVEEVLGEKLEPDVRAQVELSVGPEHVLPEGEKNPYFFYQQRLKADREAVRKLAHPLNASVPEKLGLEDQVDDARVPEQLARTLLARTVAETLVAAGVRRVEAIRHPEAAWTPIEGRDEALRRLPIDVRFEADAATLAEVVARFQQTGKFLEVARLVAEPIAGAKGGAGQVLRIELALVAIDVLKPEKPVDGPRGGPESEPGGRRPFRRRSGRLR